jgi:predicted MFS family arabinose efflux permease
MALFGIVAGLFDVALNAQATELERRAARPLMSGLHAWFSVGGLAGAAAGAGLLAVGLSPAAHLGLIGALGVVAVLLGTRHMLAHRPAPQPGVKARPHGALLLLGLLAASGLVAEGAMYDWSVLLMAQTHGATPVQAAWAFGCFSAAMAAGRFGGDGLRARWRVVTLLRASGLVAAAGMALTLAPVPLWGALLGCAGVGLGLANVVPLLFSASARVPGATPAAAIATVSALGYAGLMVGPPMFGFVAERSSLTASLWLVVGFALFTTALAGRALRGLPASGVTRASAPDPGQC